MSQLKSLTVHLEKNGVCIHLTCSPEEAFALVTMPALAGLISVMVPEYGLSSLPETQE